MRKITVFVTSLLLTLGLVVAACGPATAPTATEPTQPPEPTAVPRVCDGECQAPVMAAVDIINTTGFHGMSEDLTQAAAVSEAAPTLGVMVAQDIIDSAGFHGMGEAIAEAESMEDVSPRTVGTVEKALWVSQAAPYPTAAADALAEFQADAEALIEALNAGDLEAAKEASHAIHESQHGLSQAAFEYLAGQEAAGAQDVLQAVNVMAAQDIIDSAGFHGMSEAIAEAQTMEDVSPRSVGNVEEALSASRAVAYPEALAETAEAFQADAEALIEALNDGDLEAAKEASHAIHASQHDLAHDSFAWLAEQSGEFGDGLVPTLSVIAGQDIIDSSGFHGMSEAIAEAQSMEDVSPRTAGTVEEALWASRAASYPESMAEALAAFQADAEALIEALEAGDLEAAKEASHAIHESQHGLSHQAYEWVSSQDANALMSGLINPRYQGRVQNVYNTVGAVEWPDELTGAVTTFQEDLAALLSALEAGDVFAAAEAGHAIHGSQHDLSHEVYHWLGEQRAQTDQIEAIAAAIDIIDSAGFHGMAEEIDAASSMEDVSPRNAGKVQNALAAAETVEWPAGLQDAFDAFRSDAETLVAALEAGDLEAAKEASHAIHESQHGLSHDSYAYLADNPGAGGGVGAVLVAQDAVDSAGFHGMAHELGHASSMEDVNPRYLSTVEKVIAVAKLAAWPGEVEGAAQTVISDLEALAEALEAGDLAAAQEAAGALHSSQHDLSHETYAMLGEGVEVVDAPEAGEEADPDTEAEDEDAVPEEYADAELVTLTVDDWAWSPETIELEMGQPVVLEITNEGVMPHGIWVPELNINEDTPPGEVTRVYVTPEKSGTFTLLCNNEMCGSEEQHERMVTEIVVVE